MPKPDPAHKETDKILSNMEKQLNQVYKQAYREARETATEFMKQFRQMDIEKRKQIKDETDKEKQKELKADYERWRRTQVFQGNRYHQMADVLAADMTNTNKIAASVINGHLPDVYALNHNYGTYEVENGSNINTQYTLYDRQTVERLMRDNPDLLPRKAAVNIPKDEQWNKQHINSAVLQGILQGKSNDDIAKDLATTITTMSHTSAIRNARTMTTSAENGGRIDSYKRAESMGIKMVQVWVSTLDDRTRHEHIQLDGQKRKVGEPFVVDGYKIDFPGDPSAEPFLVYNCRCCLIGQVEGVNYDLSDTSQRDSKLGEMTYQEWKDSKRRQDEGEPDKPKQDEKPKEEEKPQPQQEPQKQEPEKVDVPAPTVEKPDAVDEEEPVKTATQAKIDNWELANYKNKTESGLLILPDGTEIEFGGIDHHVTGTKEDIALMDGATFTHNHPTDNTFSQNDIITGLVKGNLAELRAVTITGDVHILINHGASKEQLRQFNVDYQQMRIKATNIANQKIRKGENINKDKYVKNRLEQFMKENAEKYNLEYEQSSLS